MIDPRGMKKSPLKFAFNRKVRKLIPLYKVMIKIANRHNIKVPQVAMAFCTYKGVIPMVGCRKPDQVRDLANAVNMALSDEEVRMLEEMADKANVQIMGADIFRPFVLKERKNVERKT